jgi:hypothetical protein
MDNRKEEAAKIQKDWDTNPRWHGIKRGYTAEDVVRLRGSLRIEHSLAKAGAEKLWNQVNNEAYVNCLGALTGGQAMQQVKAGIKAIYLSGWQVAADGNSYAAMYPDQSLYPVDSVPKMVERINNSFERADQIQWAKGINPGDKGYIDYYAPIVADAEAGFGGVLNAYELSKALIKQGAAGVHALHLPGKRELHAAALNLEDFGRGGNLRAFVGEHRLGLPLLVGALRELEPELAGGLILGPPRADVGAGGERGFRGRGRGGDEPAERRRAGPVVRPPRPDRQPLLQRELLEQHYDPVYLKSMRKHFAGFEEGATLELADAAPATLEATARRLIESTGTG